MIKCIAPLAFLALAACTGKLAYLGQSVSSDTTQETVLINGAPYTLVRYSTGPAADGTTKDLFFIGGSGCASLTSYLAPYFADAPEGITVTALEKQGVKPGDLGLRCSEAFWQDYTYDNMLARNRAALRHLAASSPMPVMGVSEGGALALLLDEDPAIRRLAILGAGGMTQREELRLLTDAQGQRAALDAGFAAIKADPESVDSRFYGMTHRYWTSALDRAPNLAAIKAPVFLAIGAKDESVPVQSAELAAANLPNADLVVVPEASHTFDTPAGSQRGSVVKRALAFLLP